MGEIDALGDAGFLGSSGVVYDSGHLTELGLGNLPLALNNAGTIVGTGIGKAGAEPVTPDGFVLRDGKFRFLRDLIDHCWQMISPIDVNDVGQIIATARTCEETPRMRVLLLDPVTVCGRGRPK